jgi:hypothetical protein
MIDLFLMVQKNGDYISFLSKDEAKKIPMMGFIIDKFD